ncbi:MAG: hypothetical protein JO157_11610 [Acetobacteraceae bacterium]|nr:hypothetical protein [Acetobacteraceae bacterium]
MSKFRAASAAEDYHWPSGEPRTAAVLAVSVADLERRIGTAPERGVESGLGAWVGFGLELASGARVELVAYLEAPGGPLFELRADARANLDAARAECLAALGLPVTAVVWVPEAAI